MRRDARGDVAEPGERLDAGPLAGGDEAPQNRRRPATAVAAEEDPVAPAQGDIAVGPFRGAVINLQLAVVQKARQRLPLIQRIAHRGAGRTLRQKGRLLGERKPILMVTDPPYGIELDSEWRDRAGLNGCGAAEPSYMKHRTMGHTETTISGDTRADWSEAFELVPSLQIAYVWHASVFTREVLNGLLRIGFTYPQQIIWNKGRMVPTRTHYWYQHEPCWYLRKPKAAWYGKAGENPTVWDSPSPKFIMGGSGEEKYDHPAAQKPSPVAPPPVARDSIPIITEGGLLQQAVSAMHRRGVPRLVDWVFLAPVHCRYSPICSRQRPF